MPRKVAKEQVERPAYLDANGQVDFSRIFRFQAKQMELLRNVHRNGGYYVEPAAGQCLSVGGIRSGKTTGVMMFFIQHYCMKYKGCDMLILRRTFKELESGAIADFKTFMPKELYNYDQTKHVATLTNGSRIVFGHCLAGGTLITTQRGLVPIEEVTTEDMALTRKGLKRILWSGKTGDKPVVQFGPLFTTREHKFLVNGEWKSVEEIECQKDSEKTVHLLSHKPSYLKALSITDIQKQNEGLTEFTTKGGETELKPTYMSQCGFPYTEQYPKDTKSTTSITIPYTTKYLTWNSSQLPITGSTTHHGELGELAETSLVHLGKSCAGSAESPSQQEQLRKDFVTLTVGMPSEQTSDSVPVYDLQVEDEHEFFANGVLVHNCQNNKDRDIEQYLGQAYPAILVDEAGQFSPDAWQMLFSRNIINAACQPDELGNFPKPCIWGCTNPLGPHYEYYRTLFIQKEPWMTDEDSRDKTRKDETNGTWWAHEAGEWKLIYNPDDYASQRSTVLDNAELLKRDPGIISRLMLMPKAKRDKVLYGLDGKFEGQYFDVFDPTYHVINLREDPEVIIWQMYQPVWIGQDWGVKHANSVHFFTRALVRKSVGEDYVLKTVCFAEVVSTGGKTGQELSSIIKQKAKLPNGVPVDIKSIYFSHEKFSRQITQHSPADEYTKALRAVGLPPVTRATQDRIGSASLMYNMLKRGELVILDTCKDIILSIPSLMRDPDLLDDVLKVDSRGDDVYDSFRYGLYGQLAARKRPEIDAINEHAKKLDPLAAHFYLMKQRNDAASRAATFVQPKQAYWINKQK